MGVRGRRRCSLTPADLTFAGSSRVERGQGRGRLTWEAWHGKRRGGHTPQWNLLSRETESHSRLPAPTLFMDLKHRSSHHRSTDILVKARRMAYLDEPSVFPCTGNDAFCPDVIGDLVLALEGVAKTGLVLKILIKSSLFWCILGWLCLLTTNDRHIFIRILSGPLIILIAVASRWANSNYTSFWLSILKAIFCSGYCNIFNNGVAIYLTWVPKQGITLTAPVDQLVCSCKITFRHPLPLIHFLIVSALWRSFRPHACCVPAPTPTRPTT